MTLRYMQVECKYKQKVSNYYANFLTKNTTISRDVINNCIVPYIGTVEMDKNLILNDINWDVKLLAFYFITHNFEGIMNENTVFNTIFRKSLFIRWLNIICPENSNKSVNPYKLSIFLQACKYASKYDNGKMNNFVIYRKLFTHNQLMFINIKKLKKKLKVRYEIICKIRNSGKQLTTKIIAENYDRFFRHLYKSGELKSLKAI